MMSDGNAYDMCGKDARVGESFMNVIALLDASPETCSASYFAISLAKIIDCRLTAATIINAQTVFMLMGYAGRPGLCGSGVFLHAYEQIIYNLREVGESLLMAFVSHAEGAGLQVETYIDVGEQQQLLSELVSGCDTILVLPKSRNSEQLALSLQGCSIVLIDATSTEMQIDVFANDSVIEQLESDLEQMVPDKIIHSVIYHPARAA